MTDFYASYPIFGSGGSSGVTSLNGLTGALTLAAGTGITIVPAGSTLTINATGGSGTVTSVGLSLPAEFTVTGSPVTTSGTLSASYASQLANLVFASPNGAPGTPSFRSLVAADIPALPYASSALTDSHIFVGNAGNVATDVAVSGDLTLANTGAFTIANLAVTNAKIANATIDLTTKVTGLLPTANGGTNHGNYTAGSVIFAGAGGTSLDQDNAQFFWDDSVNRLGIGTNAPGASLHVLGDIVESISATDGAAIGISATTSTHTTADGSSPSVPFYGTASATVDAGFTNFDSLAGYAVQVTRGDGTDDGTLFTMAGGLTLLFHNAGPAGTTTRVFGNRIVNFLTQGTITDAYDLSLLTIPSGTGTIGNHYGLHVPVGYSSSTTNAWGIWVGDTSTNNYFANNVVIGGVTGLPTGAYALDVTGSVKIADGTQAAGFVLTSDAAGAASWQASGATGGTVTSVSVVSANGFAGTVATATTTPAITLSTTVTGLLKGNGTSISAAIANTDYQTPISTFAAPANQFLTGFTAPNTFTAAQPSFANLSGNITAAQMLALPTNDIYVGNGSNQPAAVAMSGDATIVSSGALTLATVNGNVGSFTNANITVNAKGLITAASNGTAGLSATLTDSHIFVGNASNVATDVAVSGDLTLANTGAFTIASIQGTTVSGTTGTGNVVFSAAPTLTGLLSGGSASFSSTIAASNFSGSSSGTNTGDVTLAAVGATPNANAASLSGQVLNLQPFSSTFPGVVTASGGGTTNFLRADGTFAVPPGTSTGTVTSVSVVTANGVSGSVATATTTPAITLTLGAITPTSVAATGTVTGSNLSGTNTGDQTITLTGDVTGSGTGSFATTIANLAVTNAKIANATIDLTTKVTGVLPVANGGNGARTINTQTGTSYTFALTDGTNNGNSPLTTLSNAATITATIPPNSSVAFPIGSQLEMLQLGAGNVIVTPGSGVTINSYLSRMAMLGQYTQVVAVKIGTDTWDLYGDLSPTLMIATGGTITTDGNFKVHTFTSSGTFQVLSGSGTVASLVIAGGGGGGKRRGGGGGAGDFLYTTPGASYGVGSYTVTVGAGGAGSTSDSTNGSDGANSVFDVLTAVGGGGGGSNSAAANGNNGGSGGGGEGSGGAGQTGGTSTANGLGNAGGNGVATTGVDGAGGGGGGSGSAGSNASVSDGGGGGGGTANSITGSSVTYASGGGGGSNGATPGSASAGGGGAGSAGNGGTPGAGTANTGGGGGGGGGNIIVTADNGANGGSGVVILRYQFQ